MDKITRLIQKFRHIRYAEFYNPCSPETLEEYKNLLVDSGHAWTDELTKLYHTTNGFFYNGIYVFTLRSAETNEDYDILVQNVKWDISDRLPGCVLFGRSDEEVYVFNSELNAYQILDITGWDEYYTFNTLDQLLEFVVNERI